MIVMRYEGDKKLVAGLERLQSPAEKKELMETVGSYGVSSTQERFIEEKGPDGEDWAQSGRVRQEGGQTLRDSGRLFQSLTYEAGVDYAAWGSNVIYAGIHQHGGTIKPVSAQALVFRGLGGQMVSVKSVTIPARPYLGINAEDEAEIHAIVNDWLSEAFQ